MPVTPARKRYMARSRAQAPTAPRVFACAVCGGLSDSTRAHAITCSPACRVRLHRKPEILAPLEHAADAWDVSVASILECRAIAALRPDLVEQIQAGSLTIAGSREDVHREFVRLVMTAAREVIA